MLQGVDVRGRGHPLLQSLEQMLAHDLGLGNRHGIDTVEERAAEVLLGQGGRLDQCVEGDLSEGVGADRAADLLD